MATDRAGSLYVADFANRRIQKFTSLETAALPDSQVPGVRLHACSGCTAGHVLAP